MIDFETHVERAVADRSDIRIRATRFRLEIEARYNGAREQYRDSNLEFHPSHWIVSSRTLKREGQYDALQLLSKHW